MIHNLRVRYFSQPKHLLMKVTNDTEFYFNKGFDYSRTWEDEELLWSITDRFGKELFPKRKGRIIRREVISDEYCYILVEENDKKDVYRLYSSRTDSNESYAYIFKDELGVKCIDKVYSNPDYMLLTTKKGTCFISTKTGEQTSDFYSRLHNYGGKWKYDKEIKCKGNSTTISGPISYEGKVGSLCYDSFFNKNRRVKKKENNKNSFDVINTNSIREELLEYYMEQKALKAKIKK